MGGGGMDEVSVGTLPTADDTDDRRGEKIF